MGTETGHATALLNALPPGECLTLERLAEILPDLCRRQITNAAARLIGRDLVERVERGCFRLTAAGVTAREAGTVIKGGPRGRMERRRPVRKGLIQRLWRAMRLKRKFTVPGLLELAARDEKSAPDMTTRYLRALARAGYVHRLPRREPGGSLTSNGYLRWSLIRDTGEMAPVVRGDGTVFDPNTGETHQSPSVASHEGGDLAPEGVPCTG